MDGWPFEEQAIRTAFDYRGRGAREVFPVTYAHPDGVHVYDVFGEVWDDPKTWRAVKRPATEEERKAIGIRAAQHPIGTSLTIDGSHIVRGYVCRPKEETDWRPAREWNFSIMTPDEGGISRTSMRRYNELTKETLEIDPETGLRRRLFLVDKRQCHIRFADESEDFVTIVVERKEVDPFDVAED